MAQYEAANLIQFVKRHVRRWTHNAMIVSVTWGYGRLIKCEVQEFEPNEDFLSLHFQYRWSMMTNRYETVRVSSAPIGMISSLHNCPQRLERLLGIVLMEPMDWRRKLHSYLDREVEENFAGFPERFFRGEEFEVQKDILCALHDYHVALKEKVIELGPKGSILVNSCEALKLCKKLLMITHMMTRTFTLIDSSKQQINDQLLRRPIEVLGVFTFSEVLNKEWKWIIASMYRQYWTKFLDQLHNILLNNHRDKVSSWATVLGCLFTLVITMESVQIHVRCKEATDKCDKVISEDSNFATLALEQMEEKWELLLSLFHRAYRLNPIHKEKDREELNVPSQIFAQNICKIIEKHRESFSKARITHKSNNKVQMISSSLDNCSDRR